MKKSTFCFLSVAFVVFMLSSSACNTPSATIRPSGKTITKTVDVPIFTAIEVSSAIELDITQNDAQLIQVTTDENFMEYIICEVKDHTLKISRKSGVSYENGSVLVKVNVPNLTKISASGASKVKTTGNFQTHNLEIESSGASKWNGTFTTNSITIEASGASSLNLSGSTGNLKLDDFSGASSFNGYGLTATNCDIDCSGASKLYVNVSNSLTVEASGASRIFYKGPATLSSVSLSGASTIEQAN